MQVLDEPGKTAQSKSYMWVMTNASEQMACVFHYADNRSQSVPLNLLNHENTALMLDDYEWHQKACDEYDIIRLGCSITIPDVILPPASMQSWTHARRKFKEAQDVQPKASAPAHAPCLRPVGKGKTGKADQGLAFIQKLYAIEKRIKDEPPDKRYQIRQDEAKPILKKLKDWMDEGLLRVPPKTAIGKALVYLNNQWDRLIGYVGDGRYPIDNNAAERAIRPFAIDRKNWMFSKSQAGAKNNKSIFLIASNSLQKKM